MDACMQDPREAFEQVIATLLPGGFIALADCDSSTQLSGLVNLRTLTECATLLSGVCAPCACCVCGCYNLSLWTDLMLLFHLGV